MRDMVAFAAAAMGNSKVGKLEVPAAVTNGFKIAETSYACQAEIRRLPIVRRPPHNLRSRGRSLPPIRLTVSQR